MFIVERGRGNHSVRGNLYNVLFERDDLSCEEQKNKEYTQM